MKAALLTGKETIEIREIDEPAVAADRVLIQPILTGICGTDISIFQGHRAAPQPAVLGHEVLGRILDPGQGSKGLRSGQRVIVEPNYPCGTCALCRKGRGSVCADKISMGVNEAGCFARCVSAPAEFVWALPDSISDRDAATIEPLTVSLHALRQSAAQAGDAVAVLGCGVIGLLLIHAAAAMGIRVLAHDRFEDKLQMAHALGAEAVPPGEDAARRWLAEGVSTVFECAGVPATVELALSAAPRGAGVVLLGLSSSPASFLPMRLVREGIDIRTSMIYDHPADFAHAMDLVAGGVLHPASIVTHTYSLDSLHQALVFAATGKAGKIHIRMT